jgi:outer membrane protein TolC
VTVCKETRGTAIGLACHPNRFRILGRTATLVFALFWSEAVLPRELGAQAGSTGQARPLSLAEAIDDALAANSTLRIADARLEMAEAQEKAVASRLLPRLDVSAGYLRSVDPVAVFGTKLRQGIFTESDFDLGVLNDPEAIDDWMAIAELRWSAVDLTSWAARSAAGHEAEASAWRLQRTREATILGTRVLYYRALAADGAVREAEVGEEAGRATVERFERRRDQGLLTDADVLQAQAELRAAEARRIDAIRRRDEHRAALGLHLGWDSRQLPAPSDALGSLTPPDPPSEGRFDGGSRADLRMLASLRSAAQAEARGSRLGFLPALDGFAQYANHAGAAVDSGGADWTVGLVLRWNLFFGRFADGQRTGAARRIGDARYEDALRAARSEFDRAREAVSATESQVLALRAAVVAAEEARDLMRRRFEEGLATASDLLQAEARAVGMRQRAVEALAAQHIALARLDFVSRGSDSAVHIDDEERRP